MIVFMSLVAVKEGDRRPSGTCGCINLLQESLVMFGTVIMLTHRMYLSAVMRPGHLRTTF